MSGMEIDLKGPVTERRSTPRLVRGLALKISCGDFDIVTETKNISLNGVYCSVDRHLELMSKLAILLLLPFPRKEKMVTRKVSCSGVIVRDEPPRTSGDKYHAAIYFNEMSGRNKKLLSEFLALFSSP